MEAEERIRPSPEAGEGSPTGSASDPPAIAGDAPEAVAHERCVHHPGRAAVVRCSACEEPLCLACAVPVRGRVIGTECLAAELGDPALTAPPDPEQVAGSRGAVVGAVLAVVATIGPWTRAGAGDRIFGAWVPSVRWSMVAAAAALVLLPAAWWFRARGSRAAAALVLLAGAAVVSGSAFAIAFPPTFQAASWGPWLAAVGGAVSVAGAVTSGIMERRPRQGI